MMKRGDSEESTDDSSSNGGGGGSSSGSSSSGSSETNNGPATTTAAAAVGPNLQEDEDEQDEQEVPRRPQQHLEEDEGQGPVVEGQQILPGTTQNAEDATSYQKRWAELYGRLVAYKEKHGHCRVPNRYEEDPQLGYWVSTQRRQRRLLATGGTDAVPLSAERAKKLEDIGFEWSAVPSSHKSWDGRYAELCDFVAKKGHAQVPMGYEENPRLATWVSTQRQEYKLLKQARSSRLTEAKKKKLDDVGFVWEAQRGRRKIKPDGPNKTSEDLSSDGGEDEVSPEKEPPRSGLKEPPPASLKEPPHAAAEEPSSRTILKPRGKPKSESRPKSKSRQPKTQASSSREVSAPVNPIPSTAQVPPQAAREETLQPPISLASNTALERIRAMLAQPREGNVSSSASTASTATMLQLNQNVGSQPNNTVTAQRHITSASTLDSQARSLAAFQLNHGSASQPNATAALRTAVSAAVIPTDPGLLPSTTALLEQGLLRQLMGGSQNLGQALALSRQQMEENTLQALLRQSGVSPNAGGRPGTTNLTNILGLQQRINAPPEHNLLNEALLRQLAQQQEQQRQAQQLDALRSIQALNAPYSVSQHLSQVLGQHSAPNALLLQSNSASSTTGGTNVLPASLQQHPAHRPTQHLHDHLPLQNRVQPNVSLEELQQAQLRVARQLDVIGGMAPTVQPASRASLEEKTVEQEDRIIGPGHGTTDRKRSANPSSSDPKSKRRS